MSSVKNVFVLGGTGYIGGSVLHRLLKNSDKDKYKYTALVRSNNYENEMKSLGVDTVQGDLSSLDLLYETAKKSDIVINCADADHLESVQALVNGLKARNDKNSIYLHTSGTGLLIDLLKDDEDPVDDSDMKQILNIPMKALHKNVDQWIFDNAESHLQYVIIAPSTINGLSSSPFKKNSVQVITMARASVGVGKAGYPQSHRHGKDRWNNVHIEDLVELYNLVLQGLIRKSIPSGVQGGFYFGITNEHTWGEVAHHLAKELKKIGKIQTEEVIEFDNDTMNKYFNNTGFGESRGVANRAKTLGWKPTHPNVYETIPEELKYLVESKQI
ncbi:hypothetical protein DLAC_07641 [Tieghemostelium lacteum]|uniref:NAD(P)-binding domain-containing protein n=1 Tax=Tieghemostelium lacteum TaxID=361077 RepID=A0A151ZD32_TIELA|nr:hypothetical protein DLAC_07641 [Tieghemostelium lacteum]|eukprot:KYQ91839.1 hypothetical protein DLAC_07641 [Tieghemostelium lacteum]